MEKIKYENTTNLNHEQILDLLAKQTLPLSKMIMIVISILVLSVILILNWDSTNPGAYIMMSILLGFGLVGVLLLIFGKKWLIKVSNKSLKDGVTYKYVFYENEFVVDTIVGENKTHNVMKYEGLEKIDLKDGYAFLYLNNVSIYFVDMNEFYDNKLDVIKLFAPFKKKKSKR